MSDVREIERLVQTIERLEGELEEARSAYGFKRTECEAKDRELEEAEVRMERLEYIVLGLEHNAVQDTLTAGRYLDKFETELTLEKQQGEAYRAVIEAATIHIRLSDAYRGANTGPRPKMVDVVQSREDLREALRISQGNSK